ncbi:putative small integral membrane protein [Variovorax boronicumulans]|uniref:DUF2165 domain-containing protein n=1 Tax=Variovorax boronicumulans TaxID=436515 RepID=UPI00277F72ED|nr:DUF2165 domain-containing protein [Variovorax boronicumulans]MDQ0015388.1 putative small integral membrane protein [Variovorax boronicumulans]
MDIVRLSKIAFVAAIGFFASMTVWGNIDDYQSRFSLARHVLFMETMFPFSEMERRAIEIPRWNHVIYISIIAVKALVAAICWFGAFKMLCHVGTAKQNFNESKQWAVGGLALGFIVWLVELIAAAREFFGMRIHKSWSEMDLAILFCVTTIAVLIFISMVDEERDPW